jgi:hypothetical protein
MTDNDDIPLSRRSLLAGLGTVGLASAGAGFGTTALFTDTEPLDGNALAAGSLNLSVEASVVGSSDGFPGVHFDPRDVVDGAAVSLAVDDVKPGDWFVVCFDLRVDGNPGYLRVSTADLSNHEGANPEPETDVDPPGDLGDALLVSAWREFGASVGDRHDLSGLAAATNRGDPSANGTGYAEPDEDGVTPSGAEYTTLNEAHATYGTGVTLTDGSGDPLVVGGGDTASWCVLFELPAAVGNEVQGDEVGFTLSFGTEQVRNNPTPFGHDVDLHTGTADWRVRAPGESAFVPAERVTAVPDAWDTADCAAWIDTPGDDGPDGLASDPVGVYEYAVDFEAASDDCTLEIEVFGADNPVGFYLDEVAAETRIGGATESRPFDDLADNPAISAPLSAGSHTLIALVENETGSGDGTTNPSGLLVCGRVDCPEV